MDSILETARLLLRPPEEGDIAAFVPLIGNFNVAKNLSIVPHPYGEADGLDWVLKMRDRRAQATDYAFALIRKEDGAFIGACGVHPSHDFELGYWIGEPYWGQGYATEAAWAVVRFAFDRLGTAGLVARYMYDNPASGRVLTKLGFVYTHDAPGRSLARGGDVLSHWLALSRERFRSINVTP